MSNINLSWPDNPAEEQVTSYEVEQAYNGGGFVNIGSPGVAAWVITDAPAGTYQFRVRANNLAGVSIWSNEAATPGTPSQPGDITVTVT
jgi:hypothetical protein